jgi:uncharacterized protein YcfL
MKKVFVIIAIASLTSCGSETSTEIKSDSTFISVDSVKVDSVKVDSVSHSTSSESEL